jgi:hypothetical protein
MRQQARHAWVLIISTLATGCADTTTPQTDRANGSSNTAAIILWDNNSSSSLFSVPAQEPTPQSNTLPQQVIPVTGGPPVVAIPIGGNIYQPVTGGDPFVGIPLFP